MNEIKLSEFSDLNANGGLRDVLTCYEKIKYWFKIKSFSRRHSNQPSFFIDRASWQNLFEGKDDKGNNWLKDDCEIYAFVFCLAFDNIELHNTPTHLAYFRVRSMYKKIGDTSSDPVITVEEDNIAYVNIGTAIANQRNGSKNNCLGFANKDSSIYDKIQREVIQKDVSKRISIENLPPSFIEEGHQQGCQQSLISNEGSMFTKERIKGILDSCPDEKGNVISMFWEKSGGSVSNILYHFKLNPVQVTDVPCPGPPVCKNQ